MRDVLLASVFVALGCGDTKTRQVTDRHEFDTMRAFVRPTDTAFDTAFVYKSSNNTSCATISSIAGYGGRRIEYQEQANWPAAGILF
jgi:hypothetical protein